MKRTKLQSVWKTLLLGITLAAGGLGVAPELLAQDENQEESEVVDLEADAKVFANPEDVKEEEIPVIDREPFDRLTFVASNDNWVLDIDPI